MARIAIHHSGEIYFYYDKAEHWMGDSWKRFIMDDIDHAWAWRRLGIDPPVGCDQRSLGNVMSWQMALLAMMPLWYVAALEIARTLT